MINRTDRLYDLLPAIYRLRDADRDYPLRDLLRVVAEQVNVVEDDIAQLYDNWFIETAQDWAVPYIADLVGYTPVNAAGDPTASAADENRILIPRREVANTIAYRRRRGTLSVLEDLAEAVAQWPAHAVEYFRHLAWTQNLDHQHAHHHRARLVTMRSADALDRIVTPFDPFARSVDVRRISSIRSQGKFNIASVGLWIWRLKSYSVDRAPVYCLDAGKNSYTFSVLGNDAPLFTRPVAETQPSHIVREINVPTPLRRRALEAEKALFYGEGKSLTLWADWAGHPPTEPLPPEVILAADLTHWSYAPPEGFVAIDPQLGRIQFPLNQLPKRTVRVSYRYGFSADMGGGEYPRTLTQPAGAVIFQVGEHATYKKLGDALLAWNDQQPPDGVIEITDSRAYVEPVQITLADNQTLQLRAANGTRPVLRLLDWQTDAPDALTVAMGQRSEFTLDGMLVTGRGLSITGPDTAEPTAICAARVVLRHSTLVPGWGLDCDCEPMNQNKESLELRNVRARVSIHHSILGPIQVLEDEVHSDPIPIEICDSIVDAMGGDLEAIAGPQFLHAHATLTLRRATVFGIVQVHAVQLAENCIFTDCVHVARRQMGCMRFCYVSDTCRTPRRFHCQPDLVLQAARAAHEQPDTLAREAERVRPQFTARRYGRPAFAQLSLHCAPEILEGAADGAEMGVFHDLFQPQRFANLRARLEEFTPAGMDAGLLLAN